MVSHLLRIDEEEAESHDLDEHVLLGWREVRLGLEHGEAGVDDVAEQVLVVLDLLEVVLQRVSDLALFERGSLM